MRYSTAIIKYPSGRFGIAGSVPLECTYIENGQRRFTAYNTEQEAINALLALGLTHFQKADTSYYDTGRKPA